MDRSRQRLFETRMTAIATMRTMTTAASIPPGLCELVEDVVVSHSPSLRDEMDTTHLSSVLQSQ